MNVLLYGNATDKELLIQHMKSQACMNFPITHLAQTDRYEEYLEMLETQKYNLVFVMADNAAGMEGAIAAFNILPDTPIIWFSNDKNFVAQSYRLGVNYFAVKPINEKILNLALHRCLKREEALYE